MRTVAVLVLSLAFPSTLHASGSTSQMSMFTTHRVHVRSSDDDTATPGRFAIHG
jgi:hypothetical protein